jgi:hypothetical protein
MAYTEYNSPMYICRASFGRTRLCDIFLVATLDYSTCSNVPYVSPIIYYGVNETYECKTRTTDVTSSPMVTESQLSSQTSIIPVYFAGRFIVIV